MKIWCYSYHRNIPFFLQHLDSGIQNCLISTEFINNQTFYTFLFILFQKKQCAKKLCKYSSPVNISDKENRSIYHLCKPHIDNIIFFQINLRRTSRTFNYNDVIIFFQFMKSLHHIWNQFFFVFKIITGTHISQNFTIYNYLRSNIVGRLK